MQKVDLKENRQPTGVKMVNGIVSANNFYIFSESDDHFYLKMRFNVAKKPQILIKKNFCLAEIYLLFAEKTTENAPG